jgi:predicted TIM-barrel fold metal-dependent hydrolase
VRDYLRSNFHATTSGFFADAPFRAAMDAFGIDRLVFSVDYPYNSNAEGRAFLDGLALDRGAREQLSYRNADMLLGLGGERRGGAADSSDGAVAAPNDRAAVGGGRDT